MPNSADLAGDLWYHIPYARLSRRVNTWGPAFWGLSAFGELVVVNDVYAARRAYLRFPTRGAPSGATGGMFRVRNSAALTPRAPSLYLYKTRFGSVVVARRILLALR